MERAASRRSTRWSTAHARRCSIGSRQPDSLPEPVRTGVGEALASLGFSEVTSATPVSGGCINNGARLETSDGRDLFLKWRPGAPAGMYDAEAAGLHALATAASAVAGPEALVRVPNVVAVSAEGAWLLLEFIRKGQRADQTDEKLGRALAGIHGTPSPEATFGWGHDNWIGSLPQGNEPSPSWGAFWRDQRLGPQLQLARSKGYFSSDSGGGGQMDDLLGVLDPILSDVGTPALIHGDLWGGNAYADAEGLPVLIDPAVYRGDPEVDLAMTELFGGFGPHFYAAYTEVRPVSEAYHAYLRDLYQLYYLLVHVNLFGGSYVASSLRAAQGVLGEVG